MKTKSVTVKVSGACGELIQGWHLEWNEAVLVSCPIARYSQVTVSLRANATIITPNGQAGHYTKIRQAIRLALSYLGEVAIGAEVLVDSQLLPGRGMASSTADIVAGMAAIGLVLDRPLSPVELAKLACRIEPSDSLMFPDLTLFAYRNTGQYQLLGPALPLPILLLDPGRTVDTLAYNAKLDLPLLRKLAEPTQTAIGMLEQGLQEHDASLVGAAATLSAEHYQTVNHNPLLPTAQRWATETHALGLVRTHSSGMVGLLYSPEVNLDELADWLRPRFDGIISPSELTSGGYTLVSPSS